MTKKLCIALNHFQFVNKINVSTSKRQGCQGTKPREYQLLRS